MGTIKVGRKTKQLRKPLVFAQPSFTAAEAAEGEEGGREGPRAGIEKLGRVEVKVCEDKIVRPRLVGRVTVREEEMKGKVEATEKEGAKGVRLSIKITWEESRKREKEALHYSGIHPSRPPPITHIYSPSLPPSLVFSDQVALPPPSSWVVSYPTTRASTNKVEA